MCLSGLIVGREGFLIRCAVDSRLSKLAPRPRIPLINRDRAFAEFKLKCKQSNLLGSDRQTAEGLAGVLLALVKLQMPVDKIVHPMSGRCFVARHELLGDPLDLLVCLLSNGSTVEIVDPLLAVYLRIVLDFFCIVVSRPARHCT